MTRSEHSLLEHIQTILDSGVVAELSDRQLLEHFASRDREMAELCFGALIKRHGPMVFRTCMAILHDRHDAEDSFQATFLVLARKARSLWTRDSIGPWLFEVACRVAACSRSATVRRRKHERQAAQRKAPPTEDKTWDDRETLLYEELDGLPERYRAAVVLCDLEGLTQEKAAQVLGWPAGTVRSRLARGRQRLRDRLTRRGLVLSALPVLQWVNGHVPPAAVPAALAESTTHAAARLVANPAVTGTMASIGSLTEGVLSAMFWTKFRVITAGILAGGFCAGTALLAYSSAAVQHGQAAPPQREGPAIDSSRAKPQAPAPASAGASSLSPNAKARLDVARRLRDGMFQTWQIDPNTGFTQVLAGQNRYDEVIGEVLVRSDSDRVRFFEYRVAVLKRTEQAINELAKSGMAGKTDVLTVELDRLEAEDRLEKARFNVAANAAAPSGSASSELVQFLNQDPWTAQFPDRLRPASSPSPNPPRP